MNGDFEQFTTCPTTNSQLYLATPWMNPSTQGSPDYYNQCAPFPSVLNVPYPLGAYQLAHSGGGYAGVYVAFNGNVREYIEAPLTTTLSAGVCYHFEMHVNLFNLCKFTTDAIGVYFSNNPIAHVGNWYALPYTPQIENITSNMFDTLSWTLVSGDYVAVGGERYLTIGNFKNDANTTSITIDQASFFSFVYCFIDDVCLTDCFSMCSSVGIEEPNSDGEINVLLNFVSDELNITSDGNELLEIKLYDVTSRLVAEQSFSVSATINTEALSKGIYIYEVRNKSGVIKSGKIVKD